MPICLFTRQVALKVPKSFMTWPVSQKIRSGPIPLRAYFFFWTHFFFFGTVHLCTEFILMHMLTIVVVISCQGGRLGNEAVRRWQTILRIVQILLHLWAKLRIEHPKQIAALCGLLMEKHFALPVPA